MSAEHLKVPMVCKTCGAGLTIEEVHYFEGMEGKATCEKCEMKWMEDMRAWLAGETEEMPVP